MPLPKRVVPFNPPSNGQARGRNTLIKQGPVAQPGQSSGLIIRWLQVQVLPGPPMNRLVRRFFS